MLPLYRSKDYTQYQKLAAVDGKCVPSLQRLAESPLRTWTSSLRAAAQVLIGISNAFGGAIIVDAITGGRSTMSGMVSSSELT